jgi:hypothetical protein
MLRTVLYVIFCDVPTWTRGEPRRLDMNGNAYDGVVLQSDLQYPSSSAVSTQRGYVMVPQAHSGAAALTLVALTSHHPRALLTSECHTVWTLSFRSYAEQSSQHENTDFRSEAAV